MKNKIYKLVLILLVFITLSGCKINIFKSEETNSYYEIFKMYFKNENYEEALIYYKENIVDKKKVNEQVENYLINIAEIALSNYKNNTEYKDSKDELILEEISNYNNLINLKITIDEYEKYRTSRIFYFEAIGLINNNEIKNAVRKFDYIIDDDIIVDKTIMEKLFNDYKHIIYDEVKDLLSNEYYEEAFLLLASNKKYYENDLEYNNKIKLFFDLGTFIERNEFINSLLYLENNHLKISDYEYKTIKEAIISSGIDYLKDNLNNFYYNNIYYYYDKISPVNTSNENGMYLIYGISNDNLALVIQKGNLLSNITGITIKTDETSYNVNVDTVEGNNNERYIILMNDLDEIKMLIDIITSDNVYININVNGTIDMINVTLNEKKAMMNILRLYTLNNYDIYSIILNLK